MLILLSLTHWPCVGNCNHNQSVYYHSIRGVQVLPHFSLCDNQLWWKLIWYCWHCGIFGSTKLVHNFLTLAFYASSIPSWFFYVLYYLQQQARSQVLDLPNFVIEYSSQLFKVSFLSDTISTTNKLGCIVIDIVIVPNSSGYCIRYHRKIK